MYYYNANDNDVSVTTGANNTIKYAGVIQSNDGFGGYNASFSVQGSLGLYHIHFKGGSTQVKVIRYKSSSNAEGTNIIVNNDGATKSLNDLARECIQFPNHYKLLTNLKAAVASAPKAVNNQLQ
jgi:hypothetical protein